MIRFTQKRIRLIGLRDGNPLSQRVASKFRPENRADENFFRNEAAIARGIALSQTEF